MLRRLKQVTGSERGKRLIWSVIIFVLLVFVLSNRRDF